MTYPPNDGGLADGKAAPPNAGCVLLLPAKVSKDDPEFASTPNVGTLLAAANAPNPAKRTNQCDNKLLTTLTLLKSPASALGDAMLFTG